MKVSLLQFLSFIVVSSFGSDVCMPCQSNTYWDPCEDDIHGLKELCMDNGCCPNPTNCPSWCTYVPLESRVGAGCDIDCS